MSSMLRKYAPILILALFFYGEAAQCAEKPGHGKGPGGPPPAKVIVSTLSAGQISPQSEFTGTIYYKEVSNLAAETSGKVRSLSMDDGMRTEKGQVLVSINESMLSKEIEAKKASRAEVISELEKAKNDLARATKLFKKKLLAEKDYDRYRFTADGLKSRSRSLNAEIERLSIELSYKSVRSPFDGIIMRKLVERGDWVNAGTVVARVGNDSEIYLLVNVPQKAVGFIKKGRSATVHSGGKSYAAKVHAIVPQGDIKTRTFPVKLRLRKRVRGLYQGMEGSVRLPVGKKIEALLINRDAVTSVMGQSAVYAVVKGRALMLPVKVRGFKGSLAGVAGARLKAGMKIVIKGNERLRPGQAVVIINKGK